MNYTTQMNAARQGIITKEMEAVATYEGIDVKDLMAEVAAGTIVIPANKNHKCLKPFGIGNSLKTKINVNLGTSRDCLNLDVEMEKVNKAVEMGAEAIMDLSSFGHTHVFRKNLSMNVLRFLVQFLSMMRSFITIKHSKTSHLVNGSTFSRCMPKMALIL